MSHLSCGVLDVCAPMALALMYLPDMPQSTSQESLQLWSAASAPLICGSTLTAAHLLRRYLYSTLQESLQLWSVVGALLICGSTLTVALLERRVAAAETERRAAAAGRKGGDENLDTEAPLERSIMLAAPAVQWSHYRSSSGGHALG